MLSVHTLCHFTRLAVESLLKSFSGNSAVDFFVIDSRSFSSLAEMHHAVIAYFLRCPDSKAMVISSNRFTGVADKSFGCSIQLDAPLREWLYLIHAITENHVPEGAVLFSTPKGEFIPPDRLRQIMELLRQGYSPDRIAEIIDIRPNTVYSHISALKEIFMQKTLAGLIRTLDDSSEYDIFRIKKYGPVRNRQDLSEKIDSGIY